MSVDFAAEADWDEVIALLTRSGLPIDGLREHFKTALVTRRDGRVVGSAALEVYEDGALLRSVAVDASRRGAGLGSELTAAAIRLAEALRAPALYLLTTTADGYFPKFGFESISRAEVPPAVQTSVEFVSACPASAIVMRKRL
jgi:amino-acid N-acetyltransferase